MLGVQGFAGFEALLSIHDSKRIDLGLHRRSGGAGVFQVLRDSAVLRASA
jgi:hypothetical protein